MKLTKILRERYAGIQEERDAIKAGRPPPKLIPTRLREFDKRGGLKRQSIALYAAATGEGKSLWKMHLAWAAASTGHKVRIIDMEDPKERTADRVFARETDINSAKILAADISDEEMQRIALAMAELEDWTDNVELYAGVRTGEEALELLEDDPGDLDIVDYLSAFPHGKDGREKSISNFMWGWTRQCQEMDKAGVALAQLKGAVTERGMQMAMNSRRHDPKAKPNIDGFRIFDPEDLAWCTDAGRNAKELGGMIRPGRYYRRLGCNDVKDDVMEFDHPKRNWGAEGRIRVGIDLRTARFYDLPEKAKE